jgi:HK97 family phage major capsid protein
MSLFTSQTSGVGTRGLLPDTIGQLVTQPVRDASVALTVATVVTTVSNQFRVPVLTADAGAAWTAEGDEIDADDSEFSEIVVTPAKVAGLSIISRELADDSSPAAQQLVGESIAASIARQVDVAFFGNTTTNGPDGLLSLTGVSEVDTDGTITNVDPFAEALSAAETVGAQLTSFVASPATVLALSKLKRQTGSNEPLLGFDPTAPTRRVVLGVPLISCAAVADGDVWGIPAAKVMAVVREDTRLDVDPSAYFNRDSIGIRATMRVGFAFAHEAAIVRMYDVAEGS